MKNDLFDFELDYKYLSSCVNAMYADTMPMDMSDFFTLSYDERTNEILLKSEFLNNVKTYLHMLKEAYVPEGEHFQVLLDSHQEMYDSFYVEYTKFFETNIKKITDTDDEITLEYVKDELDKLLQEILDK